MSSASTRLRASSIFTRSVGSARVCCLTICIASATEIIGVFVIKMRPKNRKAGFRTGLSRLAEAFSLDWSPSSPRQPHSPLVRIVIKLFAGSIAAGRENTKDQPRRTGLDDLLSDLNGGADGTRTRDLRRDRPAF